MKFDLRNILMRHGCCARMRCFFFTYVTREGFVSFFTSGTTRSESGSGGSIIRVL
jgi:hypothetical protein